MYNIHSHLSLTDRVVLASRSLTHAANTRGGSLFLTINKVTLSSALSEETADKRSYYYALSENVLFISVHKPNITCPQKHFSHNHWILKCSDIILVQTSGFWTVLRNNNRWMSYTSTEDAGRGCLRYQIPLPAPWPAESNALRPGGGNRDPQWVWGDIDRMVAGTGSLLSQEIQWQTHSE